jgi:hypothetical protein
MARGVTNTAEALGAALGRIAAQVDRWKKQRDHLTAELRAIVNSGQSALRDLGHEVERASAATAESARRKGGRPKGYKMSEETKRKLRLAWKKRKAKGAATNQQD